MSCRCLIYMEKKEDSDMYLGVDNRSESEIMTPASETSSLVK